MAIEVKRYLQGIDAAGDGVQWRVKCARNRATRKREKHEDNDESFCHIARTNFHNLKW